MKKTVAPIIKKAIKGLLAATILAASFSTSIEVVKEIHQEVTSENVLIDIDTGFGTLILKNRENREYQQLISDVENAVLNIEGLSKMFDSNYELTQKDKEEIANSIINTISNEANLSTNGFKTLDMKIGQGEYFGRSKLLGTWLYKNKIILHENYFKDREEIGVLDKEYSNEELIITVIHEMIHAIDFENLLVSNLFSDFEKQLFQVSSSKEKDDYVASFREINAFLISYSIYDKLAQKYDANYNSKTTAVEYTILPRLLRELFKNSNNQKNSLLARNEVTIEEVVLIGYKHKLDMANIKYENIELKDTHYYKSIIEHIPKNYLNFRYIDFENKTHHNLSENIKGLINKVNDYSENYPSFFISVDLAKLANNLRYYTNELTEQEKQDIANAIHNKIEFITEKDREKYGLCDWEEIIKEVFPKTNQNVLNWTTKKSGRSQNLKIASSNSINIDEIQL